MPIGRWLKKMAKTVTGRLLVAGSLEDRPYVGHLTFPLMLEKLNDRKKYS